MAGGAIETLATDQDVPRELVTDGVWIYWFAQGQNFGQPTPRIFRVLVAGGKPELVLTPRTSGPLGISPTAFFFGTNQLWTLPH